ncbi:MAG: amino acid-binding domain protein [Clostridiales bacterium]|jgi:hypothetical protein|nr:amino acid-binding domain protein [Clostridiales bacterium]
MKQISIFVENKPGRLNEVTKILENCDINILALTVADSNEYGILRLLVSNAESALDCLKNENFSVKLVDVIAVNVSNIKGSLHRILSVLSDGGISVEYMYGYAEGEIAALIFKTNDPILASKLLEENNFKFL